MFNILVSNFNKTQMLQKSEEMPCKTPLTLPNPLKTSKQKQTFRVACLGGGPGSRPKSKFRPGHMHNIWSELGGSLRLFRQRVWKKKSFWSTPRQADPPVSLDTLFETQTKWKGKVWIQTLLVLERCYGATCSLAHFNSSDAAHRRALTVSVSTREPRLWELEFERVIE